MDDELAAELRELFQAELTVVREKGVTSEIRTASIPLIRIITRHILQSSEPDAIARMLNRAAEQTLAGEHLEATQALLGLTGKYRNSEDHVRRGAAAKLLSVSYSTMRKDRQPKLIREVAEGLYREIRDNPSHESIIADLVRSTSVDEPLAADGGAELEPVDDTASTDNHDNMASVEEFDTAGAWALHRGKIIAASITVVSVLVVVLLGAVSQDGSASDPVVDAPKSVEPTIESTPSNNGFEATPDHICHPADETTVTSTLPYLCVIAWCQGTVYTVEGLADPSRIQIKIRPGILNESAVPLDLSIDGPSAMRLLVSSSDMERTWAPPPKTAAGGDRPIIVEWNNQKYWGVPPDLPGESIPRVRLPDGQVDYMRFATFWDAGVIGKGQPYFKPIVKTSPGPDAPAVQEADLVFEIPMHARIFGLAIMDRASDPTRALTVSEAGADAKKWPVSQDPTSF